MALVTAIGFDIKATEKKVKKIQKALRELSEDGFVDAMEAALEDLKDQTGKQWKTSGGGNLVDIKNPVKIAGKVRGAPSYLEWTNAEATELVNVRPGVRTGYMRDQLQKRNSAAYKGSRVNKGKVTFKIKVVEKRAKRQSRNYADFFENQMGLIPKENAVDAILKVNIEKEMEIQLKKAGFKQKG